jgi:very-short-patch-repair endonuclease
LAGHKFRRQHPIDRFIVDFCCPEARLVVEVDGPIHQETQEEDLQRQKLLEELNMKVIRFTNTEVIGKLDQVLIKIELELKSGE